MTDRQAGVLLHPTSLPGAYGIGELGDHVTAFLDWAETAELKLWQILPLNPPGYGSSPYGCLSSFAGNPLMISPQRLLKEGLLEARDVADLPAFPLDHVDFPAVTRFKHALLRTSWQHFQASRHDALHSELEAFAAADEQRHWLGDYALFMAIRDAEGCAPWWSWKNGLAVREPAALEHAREQYRDEIRFWEYVQFLFFRQWKAVKEAAHARGIRILGDIPIYVANDSADVWSHRELFQLGVNGEPSVVAGVPPDYFSATGQRWGNPLYRWDVMRDDGFQWWVARVRTNLRLADMVRFDHFRGFAEYWEIPASEATAVRGRWMPGPGIALFDALRKELGDLPIVAEDLGFITQDVHELRKAVGAPGMKILQFAFGSEQSPHLPHCYEKQTVVYTGTHDNDTARGWFDQAPQEERDKAMAYLGFQTADEAPWAFIRTAYTSIADTVIIPLQDILGLGSDARMNTPGEEHDNWSWRLRAGSLTREQAARLRILAKVTGRA